MVKYVFEYNIYIYHCIHHIEKIYNNFSINVYEEGKKQRGFIFYFLDNDKLTNKN